MKRNRITYWRRLTSQKLSQKNVYELHGVLLNIQNLSKKMRYYILNHKYEEEERKLCAQYLSEDDKVLEIGASIGFISIYCMKNLGIANYFSVEPNPKAAEEYITNATLNGLEHSPVQLCLADQDREISLYTSDNFWESNNFGNEGHTTEVTVKGKNLRDMLALPTFKPNVLIIDVEGAEVNLKVSDLSKSLIEKIIIEIHPRILGTSEAYAVLNTLMNAGFKVLKKIGNSYALQKNTA